MNTTGPSISGTSSPTEDPSTPNAPLLTKKPLKRILNPKVANNVTR